MPFIDWYRKLTFNRITRIYGSLEPFIEQFDQCPAKIKAELYDHLDNFNNIAKRTTKTYVALYIVYFLLYVSFVYAFLGGIAFLGEALVAVHAVSGIVGTSVLFLLAMSLNRLLSVHTSDAHTESAIIIAKVIKYARS